MHQENHRRNLVLSISREQHWINCHFKIANKGWESAGSRKRTESFLCKQLFMHIHKVRGGGFQAEALITLSSSDQFQSWLFPQDTA